MGRIIPNEESWIGFSTTLPVNPAAPTETELSAADVHNWTKLIVSLNATSSGNSVPTPDIGTLFETSVPGTSTATFTVDIYRDDDPLKDTPFRTLKRGVLGVFYISRFGGSGPAKRPAAAEDVEVWIVRVTSRGSNALASNTAQMATITCSVPDEPQEDAVVAGP